MQLVLLGILTSAFLGLNGGLWYVRPGPGLWLLGSLLLTAVWCALFLRLITRSGTGS